MCFQITSLITNTQYIYFIHVAAMASGKNPWAVISAVLVFFSFLLFISLPFLNHDMPPTPGLSTVSFHAPKENVWADLSEHETEQLVRFLFSRQELNLTDSKRATR
jgi:hypothetical protein